MRFTWRGDDFRVSTTGHVEEVRETFLTGSNKAILLAALIKSEVVSRFIVPR